MQSTGAKPRALVSILEPHAGAHAAIRISVELEPLNRLQGGLAAAQSDGLKGLCIHVDELKRFAMRPGNRERTFCACPVRVCSTRPVERSQRRRARSAPPASSLEPSAVKLASKTVSTDPLSSPTCWAVRGSQMRHTLSAPQLTTRLPDLRTLQSAYQYCMERLLENQPEEHRKHEWFACRWLELQSIMAS